jgi:ABC-type phosphate transport system substrate-binding protein
MLERQEPFAVSESPSSSPRITDRLRRTFALLLAAFSVSTLATAGQGGTALAEPAPRAPVTASGPGGRTASVSPGVDLTNEVVNVSWSGFRPTTQANVYTLIILQCRANPTSLDDCYTAQPFPDLANGNRLLDVTASDGTGSAQFEVRPASNLPQLACSASNPCSILVYENDAQPIPPGTLPAAHVVIPISFAPSQADCPNITDFDVRVDGSATSAGLFYSWAARICQGSDPVVVDYTETSSTTGRENFLAGLVDIGVTAMPATEDELSHHPDHREFSYAPVAASAMVVAYNMTDPFTGQRIENLVLSPRLVARLVTNTSIETFVRDRELLNLNPTVRFPTNGVNRILVRAERAASASILTAWFAADPEAQKFLANNDTWRVNLNAPYLGYTYPRDAFELVDTDPFYLPRQGQKSIALRLFYGVSPTASQSEPTSVRGVIGIVDLPTAKRFGLQVAGLSKPDGSVVLPTEDAIARGVADADVSPSGVLIADPTPEDPLAYPMVKVDYAMVPKTFESPAKIADVKRVLNYAVDEGQGLLPSGYVSLPEAMRAATRDVVAAIGVPASTTTTPTTEVPPAPTTSRPRYRPSATVVAVEETTTTTSTTTSTTIARSTTTELAPITVPEPRFEAAMGATSGSSALMLGLGGLSGAAILGTAPWRRWLRRREKGES